MTRFKTLLTAVPVAVGLLAAPAAHAEWGHRGGGWGHGGGHGGGWGHQQYSGHRGHGGGGPLIGALLGLGAAAVVGGIIASQQPRYYQPAPAYAPGYYPAPGYGYAPQGYYQGYDQGYGYSQ